MPIIKSAKKKLRQDIKRTKRNKQYELEYKKIIDIVKKHKKDLPAGKQEKKDDLLIKKAYKAIDKAAKKHIIHKSKASRLKSMVARQLYK
ncbi:30S ribosomal protein S20 [Candidatus Roizmanbacteria bacterium]|nr:30S ribosomal protein S20 [Candidatus Roizmanbacteria bacterium]